MKYTIGFRMSLPEEIRGSDGVEHNIIDDMVLAEQSHTLGRRVTKKEAITNVELGEINDIDMPVQTFKGAISNGVPE